MDKGRIVADGAYAELLANSYEFRSFYQFHESSSGLKKGAGKSTEPSSSEQTGGAFTVDEERQIGAIGGSVYKGYLTALGKNSKGSWQCYLSGTLTSLSTEASHQN